MSLQLAISRSAQKPLTQAVTINQKNIFRLLLQLETAQIVYVRGKETPGESAVWSGRPDEHSRSQGAHSNHSLRNNATEFVAGCHGQN